MKRLLIGLSLLLGAEGAALACSCTPRTGDIQQMRDVATRIAADAAALVEVDVRSGYRARGNRGELMRVRRTLAGRAPRHFRLARSGRPDSAACDVEYGRGTRAVLVIYRAPSRGREPQFQEGGLCTSYFLRDPQFQLMLVEAMRNRPRGQLMGRREVASLSPCQRPAGTSFNSRPREAPRSSSST